MEHLELIKSISFGERIAEDETRNLARYFVVTDQWQRIWRGDIDVIRGEKGSGKSAIYFLLMEKVDEFFDRQILLTTAEKPRGATVFSDLVANPPTSEEQFIRLWKLYLATIIGEKIRDFGIAGEKARRLTSLLEDQHLIDRSWDLTGIFSAVKEYAGRWLKGFETSVTTDASGSYTYAFKIVPSEPSLEAKKSGYISVDSLIKLANDVLEESGYSIWVLLDRLDVAFAENPQLEANALRALFRVYRDISEYESIKLKIFIRSDIWKRITEGGFREASHITKVVILEWDVSSLLNLIIRRAVNNESLADQYKVDPDAVLRDFDSQNALFYKIFPRQPEPGSRRSNTLDWIVNRCSDATKKTAPREVIHFLSSLREKEILRTERGEPKPDEPQLFDNTIFKTALAVVSETRLLQNLYPEYPEVKPWLERLRNEKTEQTVDSLATIWSITAPGALLRAEKLIGIGFFERRGSRDEPTFWVPFLYRDALNLSQGLADD